MQYTAIIKDGGLFIPNVFSDVGDDVQIVTVDVDMDAVRDQLNLDNHAMPKSAAVPKKPIKKTSKKPAPKPVKDDNTDIGTNIDADAPRVIAELDALDDSELSEMLKAYMNDGQTPAQISLDNL